MENGVMSKLQRLKKSNIVRHSVELFFTQGFASVIAMVNTSLMVKSLGMTAVGIVGSIVAYATFFDGLLNFQSYNSVIKYGSEAKAENNTERLFSYFRMAFYQDAVTAILAALLGAVCMETVSSWLQWSNEVKELALFYLITIPMNINGSTNGVLRLNDKFTYTGTISIITNALKTVFLVLMMNRGFTVREYLYVEIGRIFLYNVTVFVVSNHVNIKKYGRSPYAGRFVFDKEFTKYNIYNNLRTTVDMPTGQVVNLLINKFLGFEAVGIYTVLTKIGSIVSKVTSPISQSMLPEISMMVAKGKKKRAWQIGKKLFIYVNAIGVLAAFIMCLMYKLWMPFFMEVTMKNNLYFGFYILYLAFTSASVGIHSYFIACNYVKANLYISCICNVLYILLLFLTIQRFELYAVIGSLLGQAMLVMLCKLYYVKRVQNLGRTSE